MIPESHPLRQLFQELVGRRYAEEIGIRDPEVVAYVSHLLAKLGMARRSEAAAYAARLEEQRRHR